MRGTTEARHFMGWCEPVPGNRVHICRGEWNGSDGIVEGRVGGLLAVTIGCGATITDPHYLDNLDCSSPFHNHAMMRGL